MASPRGPQLDGLRVVAILLVVASAARLGVPGGYVGVDVFFVIAGYSVTAPILRRANDGQLSLGDLLARGARRALPLLSLGVVGAIVAAALFLGSSRLLGVARDARAAAVLGTNWLLVSDHVNVLRPGRDPSLLLHFWAIATGVQIIVVLTCLLVLVLRSRPSEPMIRRAAVLVAVLSLASLAWGLTQTTSHPITALVSPLTRGWEVGSGALVALLAREIVRLPAAARTSAGWVGLGAIVAAAFVFDAHTAFPGVAALLPVLGAVCAIGSRLPMPEKRFVAV